MFCLLRQKISNSQSTKIKNTALTLTLTLDSNLDSNSNTKPISAYSLLFLSNPT